MTDPKLRRFRYGVQVNSLGLTEAQPENNVARIVFELLGVSMSKRGRARSIQLPAWNEALGLPRPGISNGRCGCNRCWPTRPTCWSTRTSSTAVSVVESLTTELVEAALEEFDDVLAHGGAFEALDLVKGPARLEPCRAHPAHRVR